MEVGQECNPITGHVLSMNEALSSILITLKALPHEARFPQPLCYSGRVLRSSAAQAVSRCSLEMLRAARNFDSPQARPRQPLQVAEGRSLLPATLNVFSSPAGKILFRRSHIRDVAVKRLIPIDEYCKVS